MDYIHYRVCKHHLRTFTEGELLEVGFGLLWAPIYLGAGLRTMWHHPKANLNSQNINK